VRRLHALAAATLVLSVAGLPLAHAAPGKGGPPDHAPAHGVRAGTPTETAAEDPPFSIDAERARAESVACTAFADAPADVDAVVLVHGTGTSGPEEYGWNYVLRLTEERIPHCVLTYPERGFGDMQVSAEYVVVAVHEAAAISPSGRVDLVGHSQGATMPRWAVKYWPSVQALVDDFVLHAGPNHGTIVADEPVAPALVGTPLAAAGCPPARPVAVPHRLRLQPVPQPRRRDARRHRLHEHLRLHRRAGPALRAQRPRHRRAPRR
jgi:hypothetical protein